MRKQRKNKEIVDMLQNFAALYPDTGEDISKKINAMLLGKPYPIKIEVEVELIRKPYVREKPTSVQLNKALSYIKNVTENWTAFCKTHKKLAEALRTILNEVKE